MKAKRLLALVLAAAMVFALAGCVDQHPDTQEDTDADTEIRVWSQHLPPLRRSATGSSSTSSGSARRPERSPSAIRICRRSVWR